MYKRSNNTSGYTDRSCRYHVYGYDDGYYDDGHHDDIFRELTYTNREFSGADAVEYGFATHVSDNPHNDAMALARTIASKSPSAVVKAKKLINDAAHLHPNDLLLAESRHQQDIMGDKNQLEAVFSSMQKRPGNFAPYRD